MRKEIRKFLLNIFFPKFCFSCHHEGNYLCQDCKALLEISQYRYCLCKRPKRSISRGKCLKCQHKKLTGLYFAVDYQNILIKKLIQKFKYKPFIKELAKPLASLIITHFQLLDNKPNFFYPVRNRRSSNGANFVLIPIPLSQKRLKWRGFNQAVEISKELSKTLEVPLILDCLMKIKETLPQVQLTAEARKENVKSIFSCQSQDEISGKKILLVDDIYTTGSTMAEAAQVLKESGAKEVWGVVVARE
jgi:ComF family protein